MRMGATVILLPLLNPVDVAEQVATLDVITEGRFIFGVGLGYRDAENEAFGVALLAERVLPALRAPGAGHDPRPHPAYPPPVHCELRSALDSASPDKGILSPTDARGRQGEASAVRGAPPEQPDARGGRLSPWCSRQ